jgi:capsular polysaccharide export protein
MSRRSFLFLQGVASPFFAQLADRLAADGCPVFRVNFNAGDWLGWGRRPAWNFRGALAGLREFLERRIGARGITDLVLFGDRRPVHLPALALARERGLRTHVFEEGYFRPYWVTLERGGVNGNSRLPRDPAWYMRAGAALPDYGDGRAFAASLPARAWHDAAYHLAGLVNPLLFPRYRTHWPYNAAVEYAGYARRFPLLPFHARSAQRITEQLIRERRRYFLLPLQLDSDAQIRHDSPFAGMRELIDAVARSFAACAPDDARLVVKNHPLDTGRDGHAAFIRALAERLGLAGRVDYLETGDLSALLPHAQGVVTVNSTVGAAALAARRPTIALGNPIYNLAGLTFRGPLDAFWRDAPPPDGELFRRFRNTVIHATQVNGGFYSRAGIAMAVDNSRRILQAERSPLEDLL